MLDDSSRDSILWPVFFKNHPEDQPHAIPDVALYDALFEILKEAKEELGENNMSEISRLNTTDARQVIQELSELEVESLSASNFQEQVLHLTSLVQMCQNKEGW